MSQAGTPKPANPSNILECCSSCFQLKPIEQFDASLIEKREKSGPQAHKRPVCESCQTFGGPEWDLSVVESRLNPKQKKVLKGLLDGKPPGVVAREVGVGKAYVSSLQKGMTAPEFRAIFHHYMREQGLTMETLTLGLRQAIQSYRAQWNPKLEQWDLFPDNGVRLQAYKLITQIMDLMPPKQPPPDKAGTGNVTVLIQNNFDEPATAVQTVQGEAYEVPIDGGA